MRRHPYASSLLGMGIMALMSAGAVAVADDDMSEEQRKTPRPKSEPEPEPSVEKTDNLPGETNRQFAARMRAAPTTPASLDGGE